MRITDLRDDLPTSGAYTSGNRRTHVVIHHSATAPTVTPLAIARYHLSKGDPGIAYHYLVYADGTVYQCNDDEAQTWHAGGGGWADPLNANHYSLGVCLVGDFTTAPPPPTQLQAARELVAYLQSKYGPMTVIGHREAYMTSTACPGDTWPEWKGYLEGPTHMLTTLHVQRYADWQNAVVRDLRAGWAKQVNPGSVPVFPDAPNFLVRFWTDDVDASYISRGRDGGRDFVRDMADRWLGVPGGVAYELANEPDCNSNEGLANLREYTIGAIEEANRRGLKLCVLNLAEGNPHDNGASREGKSDAECRAIERWKWEQLCEAVKLAVAGGHYVGLHAYWRPTIEGPTGRYHALGRRKWDIEQLMSMGVPAHMKVLINETGIDGGIAGGPAGKGWRSLSNADAYRAEIVEAERYARTIPQIQALMYFTAGPERDWTDFEMDEGFTRSCVAPLQALGSTLPITPIQEVPVTQAELTEATNRRNLLPASMKACDARGYSFKQEWFKDGALYALAYNPVDSKYHCLKLDTGTWQVTEDVAL
jgi:hypothetical protein